jgi:hypothetical protein
MPGTGAVKVSEAERIVHYWPRLRLSIRRAAVVMGRFVFTRRSKIAELSVVDTVWLV